MKRPLIMVVTTVALTLAITGLSLMRPLHSVQAGKNVTLPDLPAGNGSATLLPNGWHITPAGTPIPLPGDLPLKMIFTPDGKYLLVNTGGYHDHSLNLIDPLTNRLVQSVDVGKNWAGMSFDNLGKTISLSAGQIETSQGAILRLGYANGKLTLQPSIPFPAQDGKERFIAGLASSRDGSLYLLEMDGDTVYKLQGEPAVVQASTKVGYRPYALALSPDENTLAVSNWGGQSVSLLDANTLTETVRIPVGSHPNELVWGKDGRLFVANSGSNSVSVIYGGKVIETIKTSLAPTDPVGSTPDALALAPNGSRLYVANADNNDVAVIDITNPKESRVLGFLPTGWYPSALAVAPDGKALYIGTGKGLRFRSNATATDPFTSTLPVKNLKYDYIGGILSGTVSALKLPNAQGLAKYTAQVMANVPYSLETTSAVSGLPLLSKERAGVRFANERSMRALSNIHHVIYIIRENRTYDQVFGDIPAGNGDPDLTIFGKDVTPNGHALAARSVLLDNLYCNGEVSEDGHQWCDAAYATDFIEKAWPNNYSGRGEPDADERLTASPAGYLWDNSARHGLTYHTYGEFSSFKSTPNSPPVFTGPASLRGHASEAWNAISFDRHDTERAALFLADLQAAEKTGEWPSFVIMSLGENHTQGLQPGKYTPVAHVAANDQALGQIVEGVSHSRFWKDTAIFVIEDDAQNGPDHVDAHRTVGLVLSPYVQRGGVDSTLYTTASFVRTMEMILHLPPMTQYDRNATPLLKCFTPTLT